MAKKTWIPLISIVYLQGIKNVIFNKKTKIMKKIVFALFVATTLVACGSGASTEVKTDSTVVSTDTTLVAAD